MYLNVFFYLFTAFHYYWTAFKDLKMTNFLDVDSIPRLLFSQGAQGNLLLFWKMLLSHFHTIISCMSMSPVLVQHKQLLVALIGKYVCSLPIIAVLQSSVLFWVIIWLSKKVIIPTDSQPLPGNAMLSLYTEKICGCKKTGGESFLFRHCMCHSDDGRTRGKSNYAIIYNKNKLQNVCQCWALFYFIYFLTQIVR